MTAFWVTGERGDSEYPSDIVAVPFRTPKGMDCNLKLRPKLMGTHLGAQKGARAGPPEVPDWSLHPDLEIPPEKLKPLDYKGEVKRKESPNL
jgi:hypothetical protein